MAWYILSTFKIAAARMVTDDFGFKEEDVANIDRIIEAIKDLVGKFDLMR